MSSHESMFSIQQLEKIVTNDNPRAWIKATSNDMIGVERFSLLSRAEHPEDLQGKINTTVVNVSFTKNVRQVKVARVKSSNLMVVLL